MATKKTTAAGLALACPKCGACDDPRIDLNLNDLSVISCGECSAEFTAAEAVAEFAEKLAAWQKVVRLIDLAAEMVGE